MSFPTDHALAGHRPRLLIADDDPVVCSTLSMALEHRFEVIAVVGDAEDAVAKATEGQPDAALIDVDMPGGGQRAVSGIAQSSPATALIILSGDESEGVVVDLLQSGAMAYCRKGVDHRRLGDTIERSIRAHRALRGSHAG